MNILFVTHAPPYPPMDGARVLVYNLACRLCARHRLSLVSLVAPHERAHEETLRQWFQDVRLVPQSSRPRWQTWAQSIVDELPLWVRACASRDMDQILRQVVASGTFDVIHVDTGLMAQYADAVAAVPTLLAPHDALTWALIQRAQQASDPIQRWLLRLQIPRMRRYEAKQYARFARVHVVTPFEKNFLAQLNSQLPLVVIPYGVDTDFFRPGEQEGGTVRLDGTVRRPFRTPAIGFLGVMDYAPNEAAVLYFAREVLPIVWKDIPDARFTIIGRNPTRAVRALNADPRITVTGTVEDVRPYIAEQTLMVCPIRAQGGIKNKLLETLAMGKTVVASPESVEGLDVRDGQELVVASGTEAFAGACVRLLHSAAERKHLEARARAWALEHTWERTVAAFEKVYGEAASTNSAANNAANE